MEQARCKAPLRRLQKCGRDNGGEEAGSQRHPLLARCRHAGKGRSGSDYARPSTTETSGRYERYEQIARRQTKEPRDRAVLSCEAGGEIAA